MSISQTIETTTDTENLFAAFARTAASDPDHTLLADPVSGERWSRSEFSQRAGRLGAELRRRGVRGRAVGLLMGNRLEFFQIDMAVLLAGGVPVSLSTPRLRPCRSPRLSWMPASTCYLSTKLASRPPVRQRPNCRPVH